MITFAELMNKYYKETGIKTEEAPTNSTGPAIANPDVPLDIKKKKKKDMTYDGRTRVVKGLVKRIVAYREKRQLKKENK
tara:strand:+ start:129 stop:365 length:237 start_codon:yes stop_codon:yes gene_type:complete